MNVTITASGPAAGTPEAERVIREIKAACVAVDDAWGPYRPGPSKRATPRAAAARSRR